MGWIGSTMAEISGADHSARENYNYSMKLQKQNQAWQTQMANTAHQREVQDLKAAGLNPVLSAGGSGAETGTPGGGSVSGTPAGNPLDMIFGTLNSITNSAKNSEEIKNIEAQTSKTNAETVKTLIDAGYSEENIKKAVQERKLIEQQIENAKSAKDKTEAETKLLKWQEEHALLIQIMPALSGIAGGIIGGALGQPLGGALGGILGGKKSQIGFRTN